MIGGHEMLAAILDPLDRPAAAASRIRNQEVLGIEFAAGAEAAADVVLDHANGAFRQIHLRGENAPIGKRHLGCTVYGEPLAHRIPFGDEPARLHRHRAMALDTKPFAPDVIRPRESGVGIAAHAAQREREIGPCRLEQQDPVHRSGSAVHDRRQRLDIGRDRIERILGGGGAGRQHQCERLADIAHLVAGDDGLLERLERGRGFLTQRYRGDGSADLGRGDDGEHTGACQRGAGLDRADAAVCQRAAQDGGMEKVAAHEIVDELAAPAQKASILDALDRAADQGIACVFFVCALHPSP